MTQMPKN